MSLKNQQVLATQIKVFGLGNVLESSERTNLVYINAVAAKFTINTVNEYGKRDFHGKGYEWKC